MKEFDALVTYYVHEFKAIQDWFGNRGIPIVDGDLKEWCYDGTFLYYVCNPSAPWDIQSPDYQDSPDDCIKCYLDSVCFEIYDYYEYSKSPFANKLH